MENTALDAKVLDRLTRAAEALGQLILYQGVLRAGVPARLAELVRAIRYQLGLEAACDPTGATELRSLARDLFLESCTAPPWPLAIAQALLYDDNPFTRAAARARSLEAIDPALRAAAAHDLRCLRRLATLTPADLVEGMAACGVRWFELEGEGAVPSGVAFPKGDSAKVRPSGAPDPDMAALFCMRIASARDWASLLRELVGFHGQVGAGLFARFAAYRWSGGERLEGVAAPDPTRLDQLVGYEAERGEVVRNTERFVAGLPAHNLLLYGPRGTGKSATVKALVHAFAGRGLRLIEVPRRHLPDLPALLARLREETGRFVLFVDDLSFEEGETAYKELKAVLEGSVEAWPSNVVVYATSNRRHLVEEPAAEGPLRPQDGSNERLSLADRFGITVIFPSADQALYLQIVEGLAQQAGILRGDGDGADGTGGPAGGAARARIDRTTLRHRALQWAMWNNERSPRTASQFIVGLVGELALASAPTPSGRED